MCLHVQILNDITITGHYVNGMTCWLSKQLRQQKTELITNADKRP
jgi:hypothetical protein